MSEEEKQLRHAQAKCERMLRRSRITSDDIPVIDEALELCKCPVSTNRNLRDALCMKLLRIASMLHSEASTVWKLKSISNPSRSLQVDRNALIEVAPECDNLFMCALRICELLVARYEEWTKQALCCDRGWVAAILLDIGYMYSHLDHSTSARFYEQALRSAEAAYGYDSERASECLNRLSWEYSACGKYDEAAAAQLRRLEVMKGKYGDKNVGVAMIYNSLARIYSKQGEYDKAEDYYRKAFKIDKEETGNFIMLSYYYENLVHLYEQMQNHSKIDRIVNEILKDAARAADKRNTSFCSVLYRVGQSYRGRNKLHEAEAFFKNCTDAMLLDTKSARHRIACADMQLDEIRSNMMDLFASTGNVPYYEKMKNFASEA